MKNILIFLSLTCSLASFSQECYIANPSAVSLKSGTNNFVPGSSIKYVRVIIHFIQKNDGTGNFNELNDGLSPANNFNGYDFAAYIIDYANDLLENNQEMRLVG